MEDHGYLISFGIENTKAFLPKGKLNRGIHTVCGWLLVLLIGLLVYSVCDYMIIILKWTNDKFKLWGFSPEFQEGHSLCLLVKSVAEDQRIITVSADKSLIQDALVCFLHVYVMV